MRKCKANLHLAFIFTGSDETITMIMANIGSGKGWSHPIHLHGHYFWVLKMGYAQYDEVTAKIVGDNLDIDCRGMCQLVCILTKEWAMRDIQMENYM